MVTELPSQIGVAAAVSYFLQYLKNSPKFAWIGEHTPALNRILATIAAGASAIGIHWTFTHADAGVYTITFTGLTIVGVLHYGWSWFTQFAIQQGYFKAVVKQPDTIPTKGADGAGTAVVAVPPSTAGVTAVKPTK